MTAGLLMLLVVDVCIALAVWRLYYRRGDCRRLITATSGAIGILAVSAAIVLIIHLIGIAL
jgi:hypothetical protein